VFLGEALSKVVKLEAHHQGPAARCTRLQSKPKRAREESPLTPELKEFIDNAMVPAFVKKYLAEEALANRHEDATHSHSRTAAPRLEIVRP
jgi:hypothetical protein